MEFTWLKHITWQPLGKICIQQACLHTKILDIILQCTLYTLPVLINSPTFFVNTLVTRGNPINTLNRNHREKISHKVEQLAFVITNNLDAATFFYFFQVTASHFCLFHTKLSLLNWWFLPTYRKANFNVYCHRRSLLYSLIFLIGKIFKRLSWIFGNMQP